MEIVIEASVASVASESIESFETTQQLNEPQKIDPPVRPDLDMNEVTAKPVELDRRESNVKSFISPSVKLTDIAASLPPPNVQRRIESVEDTELQPPVLEPPPRKPPQSLSMPSVTIVVPQIEDAGIDASPIPEPLLTNLPPKYPASELQNGIEGRVMLRLTIESQGTVSAVEIETSSGSDALDRAAMEAVIHWKFQSWGTSSVSSSRTIHAPIVFKLKSSRLYRTTR